MWRPEITLFVKKAALLSCLLGLALACGPVSRLSRLKPETIQAQISLTDAESRMPQTNIEIKRDTLKVVNIDGKEMYLMSAVQDEEGNMVASRQLDAAVVVAKFRNVAERNGKIDLCFQIIVPESLYHKDWQLRYSPIMYIMDDSLALDKVIVTGEMYRKRQNRGYELYRKFLSSIIIDSTAFIDKRALEIFLRRNIPQIYAYKNDSSFVDVEVFHSAFGVSQRQALEHYTNRLAERWNERRKRQRPRKFQQYVKAPILTEGIRLDTVMRDIQGNYVFDYVQTINTRPRLRKVEIALDGEIYEQNSRLLTIPRSDRLTFFISSLSAFVDGRARYLTKVVERKASAEYAYDLRFSSAGYELDPALGNNAAELSKIKSRIALLMDDEMFDVDSITVVASCSPEGSLKMNSQLARRRSQGISTYFSKYMKHCADSINRELGVVISLDSSWTLETVKPLALRSSSVPENWDHLLMMVEDDSVMTLTQKEEFFAMQQIPNLDAREKAMSLQPWYGYVRETMYPRLRMVRFRFALSRKGMLQDTIHTTVLDTLYMSGVQAIRDRDYEKALSILGPYEDFNTAVACLALDRNLTARSLLDKCPDSDKKEYMLAIINARLGDEQAAVQHYINSCGMNAQFVHRGNLDPEISALINKYGLNREEEY